MSKYLINFAAVRNGGTRNYARGFLSCADQDRSNEYVCVLGSDQSELADRFSRVRFIFIRGFSSATVRFLVEQILIPFYSWRENCDAVFNAFDVTQVIKIRPVLLGMRNPSLILQSKGFYNERPITARAWYYIRNKISYYSLCTSDAAIYPTQYFRDTYQMLVSWNGSPGIVVNHGKNEITSKGELRIDTMQGGAVHPRYILTASNLYEYKNIHVLIQAISLIDEDLRKSFKLKIVGKIIRDSSYFQFLEGLVESLSLGDRVEFLDYVPDQALKELYLNATLFVFPSEMETFGFPMVEALAYGCPLLVNDTPFSKEICGDAAWYYSYNDPKSLADNIHRIFHERRESISASRRIQRSSRFSWEREFSETLTCLKGIH